MKAIPVGRTSVGTLYFVIDGESDGVLVDKERKTHNVNFLSFIAHKPVKRILTSDFHEFLWSGVDSPNDRWRNIIESRVQPIPDSMLAGTETILKFPKTNSKSAEEIIEEKEVRASELKSLMSSGNHEKALGRALRRGAGRIGDRATGAVRGFVRGATFDPDSGDADGDGFVQEGTQFARRVSGAVADVSSRQVRRAKKFRRAQNRIEARQVTGMASIRNYLPSTPSDRWVQRSKEHYSNIYEKDTKRVLDMFHGGKPIKTYGDLRSAMNQAHPNFISGVSKADYFADKLANNELLPAHYEHAMGFMLALSWNQRLNDMRFDISAYSLNQPGFNTADGSIEYKGRQRLAKFTNGFDFVPVGPDDTPSMMFKVKYQEETSYDKRGNLDDFGNFQLEVNKMFFTMLEDTPGDFGDAESVQAWQEARAMAQRAITSHEMTHVAHMTMSMDDALSAAGFDRDEGLTVLDVHNRVKEHIEKSMSDTEVKRALREQILVRKYGDYAVMQHLLAGMDSENPRLDGLWNNPIAKADGSGQKIGASQGIADFFNALGRRVFPNPTGHSWKAGDPIAWDQIHQMFFAKLVGQNSELFSTPMSYMSKTPWNGRVVAPILKLSDGTPIPVPDLALMLEHGLPKTKDTPAVTAEDVKPIVEAMIRLGDMAKQRGEVDTVRPLRVPGTDGAITVRQLLDSSLGSINVREALTKAAYDDLAIILSDLQGKMSIGDLAALRALLEQFFAGTKRFDDLTERERELVRMIAKLGSQGPWASYMAAHIARDADILFDFHDMELFAELGAANALGNEIFIKWGDSTRGLNDEELAVVAKVQKWLFPDADMRIN